MKKIDYLIYESEKGQSIHSFAEELYEEYKLYNTEFYGIFNDIKLVVNQYENPMSLYWQYKYKMELERR